MADAQAHGSGGGPLHQDLGSNHEQHKAASQFGPSYSRCSPIVFVNIITFIRIFTGSAHLPNDVDHRADQQGQTGLPSEPATGGHAPHRHRHTKQQWHIAAYQPALNSQRHHQGAEPKHNQHVENVAANDVANGDIIAALNRRDQAHEQLWGAGAERHHREPDHDLGNAKQQGHGRGPTHKQFAATK